jgi:phage/plasmid primase-like uncharacterized protein
MSSIAMKFPGRNLSPSLAEILPNMSGSRKEKHGPCFRCGGKDRFIVFLDSGRGWCRQCHWKGDSIQLLIDRDGLTFPEAKRQLGLDTDKAPSAKRQATIHSLALAAAKRSYADWPRTLLSELTDQYRELSTECYIAEVGYRATTRNPKLYTDAECSHWAHRLASLYDRIATLENDLERDLDILTYDANEPARFDWWLSESGARHA